MYFNEIQPYIDWLRLLFSTTYLIIHTGTQPSSLCVLLSLWCGNIKVYLCSLAHRSSCGWM